MNHLYIYIYPLFFKGFFPIEIITEHSVESPMLYSRSLLVFYFIYISVSVDPNLPICPSPNSFPPGNSKLVFYIYNSISVLEIRLFVPLFKIPHIHDIIWYLSFFSSVTKNQVKRNKAQNQWISCGIHCYRIRVSTLGLWSAWLLSFHMKAFVWTWPFHGAILLWDSEPTC